MSIIIGGLLVISLLLRPSLTSVNDIYRELLPRTQIVHIKKREPSKNEIDSLFDEVLSAARTINNLFKEDAKQNARIQAMMDLYSGENLSLTNEQMMAFIDYNKNYSNEKVLLNSITETEDYKETLNNIKIEVMKEKTSYSILFDKLSDILKNQNSIINILKEMIGISQIALAVI